MNSNCDHKENGGGNVPEDVSDENVYNEVSSENPNAKNENLFMVSRPAICRFNPG